jgi:GAF domain-containing protein
MSDSPLSQCLAELSRFFVGDRTLEETLHRVSELTLDAIPAATLAGITMIVEGRQRTAVFTDETSPEVDQAQYDSGEGPCLDAFKDQQTYIIEDTTESGPWPAFRASAAAHGIKSTLSLPLVVDNATIGALNLYSPEAYSFGDADQKVGAVFAGQAAIVLANAQAYADVFTLSQRLGQAMESRATIEQAKGILMGAQGCDEREAFDLLVQASQRENVKLRTIARRIVDNATRRQRGPE